MPDIHNLQHDEGDLRKALAGHDVSGAAEAREHLTQDFLSFKGNGTALAAYDQLAAADGAKHLQPLLLYDKNVDGLDMRDDVYRQVSDLRDTNPTAYDQAEISANWSRGGHGTLAENAKQDAEKMIKSPQDLASFEQHLRDASDVAGNPGESAYLDAVQKELVKDKAPFAIEMGGQSTAVSMQPGEYGLFKITPNGSDHGQLIQF